MPKLQPWFVFAVLLAAIGTAIHPGQAGASTTDPSSNFSANPPCSTAAGCAQAAIGVLDQARSRLGQPSYSLPSDFPQLTPAEQAFVLTDLDRTLYGLRPIPGLTGELDQAAAAGAALDRDPVFPSTSVTEMTSNWAGAYRDLPLAYEAWMYDDGPGGVNLDCTALNTSGCWGHRHNVLWSFSGSGPLAMGAAAVTDSRGMRSYAMLIVQGDGAYRPDYTYTWSQAQAAGAGVGQVRPAITNPPRLSAAAVRLTITHLRVRGHAVHARIAALPAMSLSCSLARRGSGPRGFESCGRRVVFRHLRRGIYVLRVRSGRQRAAREFRVG